LYFFIYCINFIIILCFIYIVICCIYLVLCYVFILYIFQTSSVTQTEIIVKPSQPLKRPSNDEPTVRLPMNVADSLRQALEKSMLALSVDDGRPAQGVM